MIFLSFQVESVCFECGFFHCLSQIEKKREVEKGNLQNVKETCTKSLRWEKKGHEVAHC